MPTNYILFEDDVLVGVFSKVSYLVDAVCAYKTDKQFSAENNFIYIELLNADDLPITDVELKLEKLFDNRFEIITFNLNKYYEGGV